VNSFIFYSYLHHATNQKIKYHSEDREMFAVDTTIIRRGKKNRAFPQFITKNGIPIIFTFRNDSKTKLVVQAEASSKTHELVPKEEKQISADLEKNNLTLFLI